MSVASSLPLFSGARVVLKSGAQRLMAELILRTQGRPADAQERSGADPRSARRHGQDPTWRSKACLDQGKLPVEAKQFYFTLSPRPN